MGRVADAVVTALTEAGPDLEPVAWFVSNARRGRNIERLLDGSCQALGIRYYALVHHGCPAHEPGRLGMVNYPVRWRQHYLARGLCRIDPVFQACARAISGFSWTRLSGLVDLRPQQRAMLRDRYRHGLGRGFTVPIHLPGERAASCSFAVEPGAPFPPEAMMAAQLLGLSAYEALRPLATRRSTRAPQLSPRQRDVVRLIVAGEPDRGIAQDLGLSEETVTKYANAARRRYGVARRTQLVAAALYHGDVGFDDILPC